MPSPPPVSQSRRRNRNANERAKILANRERRENKRRVSFQRLKTKDRLAVSAIYEMIRIKEAE